MCISIGNPLSTNPFDLIWQDKSKSKIDTTADVFSVCMGLYPCARAYTRTFNQRIKIFELIVLSS